MTDIRKDCIETFDKFNLSERQVVDLSILAMSGREEVLIPFLPFKAYLTEDLNIVYRDSRRYSSLETAIKKYFKLI